jgi:hypothetical protein
MATKKTKAKTTVQNWRTVLGAGALSVLSALSGAVLESTTKVIQKTVEPTFRIVGCWGSELLSSNKAPDRLTAVVLSFSDGTNSKLQHKISSALASEYDLNVIESCVRPSLSLSGDKTKNVSEFTHQLGQVIDKYGADVVLFGNEDGAHSQLAITQRKYLRYLFVDGVIPYIELDAEKPVSFLDNRFRDQLVLAAVAAGESSGCVHPIYVVCNVNDKALPSAALLKLLKKLDQIQSLSINRRFASNNSDVRRLNVYLSAIGMNLLYQIPLIRTRGPIGAVRWT